MQPSYVVVREMCEASPGALAGGDGAADEQGETCRERNKPVPSFHCH